MYTYIYIYIYDNNDNDNNNNDNVLQMINTSMCVYIDICVRTIHNSCVLNKRGALDPPRARRRGPPTAGRGHALDH